jgi:hypothetical protein
MRLRTHLLLTGDHGRLPYVAAGPVVSEKAGAEVEFLDPDPSAASLVHRELSRALRSYAPACRFRHRSIRFWTVWMSQNLRFQGRSADAAVLYAACVTLVGHDAGVPDLAVSEEHLPASTDVVVAAMGSVRRGEGRYDLYGELDLSRETLRAKAINLAGTWRAYGGISLHVVVPPFALGPFADACMALNLPAELHPATDLTDLHALVRPLARIPRKSSVVFLVDLGHEAAEPGVAGATLAHDFRDILAQALDTPAGHLRVGVITYSREATWLAESEPLGAPPEVAARVRSAPFFTGTSCRPQVALRRALDLESGPPDLVVHLNAGLPDDEVAYAAALAAAEAAGVPVAHLHFRRHAQPEIEEPASVLEGEDWASWLSRRCGRLRATGHIPLVVTQHPFTAVAALRRWLTEGF